ncbi:MAG: tRNA pseudouridine(38-40) synthase TruA [Alphaproteobacteria bacterium]|nr:tRNA pseudouridine(38-40) synthase TruA [Alphaproteobacteria bacterium]
MSGAVARTHSWRLELCWDGRAFVGWQRQPEGRTVQAEVEDALARVLGGERVVARASGRTDAGVHALQQVVAFECATARDATALERGLNHHLPVDVACLVARPAPPGFEPRRCTVGKTYRYRVFQRRARCPFRRGLVWHRHGPLDVAAMRTAAQALVGRHDFSSFQAQGCAAAHPVRRIAAVRIRDEADPDELWLEFDGHGFLRHQVRIMVGTLVEVGRGRQAPEWVAEVRDARDRDRAGPTVPAEGLWLVSVDCPDHPRAPTAEE